MLISIIVPTFNGVKMLKELVPTLINQNFDKSQYEIIISDDASTDSTSEYIDETRISHPELTIKYSRNSQNLSYGLTVNNGVKFSAAEYLVILNNDLICDQNMLTNLYQFITGDAKLGAVNAFVLDYYNRDKIDSLGIGFDKKYNTYPFAYKKPADFKFSTSKIPLFSGCAFIIRRSLFSEAGGFDDLYYLYAEDTDLALKIASRGYSFAFAQTAVCYHKHSATVSNLKIDKQFYLHRNHYYILFIFFPLYIFLGKIVPQFFKDLARFVKRKPRKYSFTVYQSILSNIFRLIRKKRTFLAQSKLTARQFFENVSSND